MVFPALVLLSDFGDGHGSGAMTGVCKRVEPALSIYELTNDVPRFDVAQASRLIAGQLGAWPRGTVFVCAVDPSAGAGQRVLACETADGCIIVGPDNGCFADAAAHPGICAARDVSALSEEYLRMCGGGASHGRNLAWCAAKIAAGRPAFNEAGEAAEVSNIRPAQA